MKIKSLIQKIFHLNPKTFDHEIQTLIFAHRGDKGHFPENTLASFQEAVHLGVDGIELDVHLSKDNHLIVIHDETINRTSNTQGLVRLMSLDQIKQADAGRWYDAKFSGQQIPTLDEVLTMLVEEDFKGTLNIEIKTDKYQYPDIEYRLSQLMTSRSWPFSYLYSSFNLDSLRIISGYEPQTELAFLTKNDKNMIKTGLTTHFIQAIHPQKNFAFDYPELIKKTTKPIRLWTVNSEQEILMAYHLNVAGIMTDYPDKAMKLRADPKQLKPL